MDEQEKPFDTVSIVILMIISLGNDAVEVFFDILAATGIGLPGEAIMEPINFMVDCIITPWFFMKCGFGGPSLAQILDDVLSLVGIPGRTICVGFGIYVANNPNSFLGKIGKTAAAIETGNETGLASKESGALRTGEKASRETASDGKSSPRKEGDVFGDASQESEASSRKTSTNPEEDARKKELEKSMEPEAEQEPEAVIQKELFQQTPGGKQPTNESVESKGDQEPPAPKKSNVVYMNDIRKNPLAGKRRDDLDLPNELRDVTANDDTESTLPHNRSSFDQAA